MALFESQFYQPQRINSAAAATAGTSNYFPQAFFNNNYNNILSDSNNNNEGETLGFYPHHSAAMKRRRELDDSGPSAKRSHYEDRMARRLNSLDLSNENPQSPLSPSIIEEGEDLIIDEVDPEILTEDSPLSPSDDFEEPIIEEPEDENRLVLSDELQRFMKNSDPQNYLSKFQKKKQGNELVLWRPLPSDINNASLSSSGNASSSSLNDRITEILDDDEEDVDINNEVLPDVSANGQSQNSHHVITFPDESSSSNRSSSSPQIIDTDPMFSFAPSTSSSSSSSCDGHGPLRMSNGVVLQTDYEPMEMD